MPRFGLLGEHDFRQLFLADTVSQAGSQISLLALPLVAVLALHATPFQVGTLGACESAAFLLVGLPAGAWVDRMRRRLVLIAGDVGRALLLASVPFTWWTHTLSIVQLYVVGLGVSVLTVFFDVAYQSYLPSLVGRDALVEGNAKLQGVQSVSQVAGPSMAGVLVQLLTAPVAVGFDALSFAVSAVSVGRIRTREPKPVRQPDAHLGREIAEGLRFVLSNRILRSIAACTGSSNMFGTIGGTMMTLFLARTLRLQPGLIGLWFSIASIGGLIGALVARRWAERFGQGPAIWLSTALGSPFALLLPLAHRGPTLWIAAVGASIYAITIVVYNVNQVSFRQQLAPDRLLGRMNATMRFLVWGTMPIGALIGGVLGSTVGVRNTLWIGAIGGCFTFLPVFLSPLRTLRELPGPADDPVDEPADDAEPELDDLHRLAG